MIKIISNDEKARNFNFWNKSSTMKQKQGMGFNFAVKQIY